MCPARQNRSYAMRQLSLVVGLGSFQLHFHSHCCCNHCYRCSLDNSGQDLDPDPHSFVACGRLCRDGRPCLDACSCEDDPFGQASVERRLGMHRSMIPADDVSSGRLDVRILGHRDIGMVSHRCESLRGASNHGDGQRSFRSGCI
jgi:hypothetical protein